MVNLPPEIAPLVELRARQLNRSTSNYIETLITAALLAEGIIEEAKGAHIVNQNSDARRAVKAKGGAGTIRLNT